MKTVGIVGCQPRIGTTTQALQLTLCLMHMGYNVAYVEMGERDYIEKLDDGFAARMRAPMPDARGRCRPRVCAAVSMNSVRCP